MLMLEWLTHHYAPLRLGSPPQSLEFQMHLCAEVAALCFCILTLGCVSQDSAALEPACTLAEGLATQYVLDAARESSASGGGWVTPKRVSKT